MRPGTVRGSFWPTPSQAGLLRVLFGPSDRRLDAWRSLQPVDVRTLDEGSFCLLPLLGDRLTEIAADDAAVPLLHGTYRSVWYRNQVLLEPFGSLLGVLRGSGIEAIVVGGASLLTRWYLRPGDRPIVVPELLVDARDGPAVRAVATAGGWRPAGRRAWQARYVDDSGRPLLVHEGCPIALSGRTERSEAFHAVRARSVEGVLAGEPVSYLDPGDELLLVVANGARTTLPRSVQWLVDVQMILSADLRPAPAMVLARARHLALVESWRATVTFLANAVGTDVVAADASAVEHEPIGRRDAVAQSLAGARLGRFGGLPVLLADHVRATSSEPPFRALLSFPRRLQETWGVEGMRELVRIARRKLRSNAARRRTARGEGAHVESDVASRRRSASS